MRSTPTRRDDPARPGRGVMARGARAAAAEVGVGGRARLGALPRTAARRVGLRLVGAGLLVATASIHLDLYLTGYRTIPTIGGLFLAQVVSAFLLAAAVLVTGRAVVAAAGALFCL